MSAPPEPPSDESVTRDYELVHKPLIECCQEMLEVVKTLPEASAPLLAAKQLIIEYTPSQATDIEKASEDQLLSKLRAFLDRVHGGQFASESGLQLLEPITKVQQVLEESAVGHTADAAAVGVEHQMRAVPLVNALVKFLWTERPSFFGKTVIGDKYNLSRDVNSCSFFVSHAWVDDGSAKLMKLHEFLWLQPLLGGLLAAVPILALELLPLGFAISEELPGFPVWSLPLVPLIGMAIVLLWIVLSIFDVLPREATPWALCCKTLWIDKCCIDQTDDITRQAGIRGFRHSLASSEKMMAFISPAYFKRLWCVYELATFCNEHKLHIDPQPEARLTLLNLKWPGTLSPFKSETVEPEEERWFTEFRCRDARCFKPSDRSFMLAAIREAWGSEEKFDRFVATELPRTLQRSKKQYRRQLATVLTRQLELLFGD